MRGLPWKPVPEGDVNQDIMPRAVVIKPVQEKHLPPPVEPQEDKPVLNKKQQDMFSLLANTIKNAL